MRARTCKKRITGNQPLPYVRLWPRYESLFRKKIKNCVIPLVSCISTNIQDGGHLNTSNQICHEIILYNIAFVNSERWSWLAKSHVDITLCQHGKFPATFLLKFFVLYYKRNIKHFFRIDIQLYQHSWKLEKLEIVWNFSFFQFPLVLI